MLKSILPLRTDLFHTICEGESIEVGGIDYSVTGFYSIILPTSFGCDSTVNLDLTVLNPFAFALDPSPITCWVTEVLIDGSPSFGDSYLWSTFDGCINGDITSPLITVCGPGNYCLTVTSMGFDQNGPVECTEEYCVEVLDDTEEIMITVDGTDVSCESSNDGTSTVNVPGDPNDYIFEWDDSNSQLTQTAMGLSGGNYCVQVTSLITGCTATDCYMVAFS